VNPRPYTVFEID